MGRIRQLQINESQEKELRKLSLYSRSPVIRQRCTIVLLNVSGKRIMEIQSELGCSSRTITLSLDRYEHTYESMGIRCMYNRSGQGRKAALTESDTVVVRSAVQAERQKISLAKEIISANKGTELSDYQLKTFLKSLVVNTSESAK